MKAKQDVMGLTTHDNPLSPRESAKKTFYPREVWIRINRGKIRQLPSPLPIPILFPGILLMRMRSDL